MLVRLSTILALYCTTDGYDQTVLGHCISEITHQLRLNGNHQLVSGVILDPQPRSR